MKTNCNTHKKQSDPIPRKSKDFPKIFALKWVGCGFGYQELFNEDVNNLCDGKWSIFTDYLCIQLFEANGGWLNEGHLNFSNFLSPAMNGKELRLSMQSDCLVICLIKQASTH